MSAVVIISSSKLKLADIADGAFLVNVKTLREGEFQLPIGFTAEQRIL